jgi:CHAT domain-containing protein
VEFFITSDRLVTFVVGAGKVRQFEAAVDPAALEQRVGVLQDLWGRRTDQWRTAVPAARALHDLLIAPLDLSGVSRLIIVPHGVLGLLPFGALRARERDRWLAEDYAINVLPTAAALSVLRQVTPGDGLTLEGGLAFAPFPRDLPATASEAEAFRTALPGSKAVVGSEATERALRDGLSRSVPVHVASHGTLNAWNPLFSRIDLIRPRTDAEPMNDGRLEVHELLGLVVNAPLVFFSGCETGRSRAVTRDPVRGTVDLTLAQAALASGATNVVSTLWRIDDAGAGEFAARFYAQLAQRSITEAVARAQRDLIADDRYASPYYWAAYTLSGEGLSAGGSQEDLTASVSSPIGRRTAEPAGKRPASQPWQ